MRRVMPANLIDVSPSAYPYPLLIKHLLHYPMVHAPDQEIVYRDLRRHSYRVFRERIGRLASGLSELGVKPGDVVAVLDWDSHRYLECYFAVPMMGAVLQTVNLSLPPEGLLFAMNDAAPSTVLVNADFLPLVEKNGRQAAVGAEIRAPTRPQGEADDASADRMRIRGNAGGEFAVLPVSGLRREHPRNDVPHHRHHRPSERGLLQSPPDRAPYPRHHCGIRRRPEPGTSPSRRRLHAVDADVPRPRLGQPVPVHDDGQQAGLSRALRAGGPPGIDRARGSDGDALRPDDPADAALRTGGQGRRSFEAEDGGRRVGDAPGAGESRAGAGHRRLHRLWAIRVLPDAHGCASYQRASHGRSGGASGTAGVRRTAGPVGRPAHRR